jgi:hypothetical protein
MTGQVLNSIKKYASQLEELEELDKSRAKYKKVMVELKRRCCQLG